MRPGKSTPISKFICETDNKYYQQGRTPETSRGAGPALVGLSGRRGGGYTPRPGTPPCVSDVAVQVGLLAGGELDGLSGGLHRGPVACIHALPGAGLRHHARRAERVSHGLPVDRINREGERHTATVVHHLHLQVLRATAHANHIQRVPGLQQFRHLVVLRLAEVGSSADHRVGGVRVARGLHDLGIHVQAVACTGGQRTHRVERGGASSEVADGLEDSAEHGECLSAPAGAVGYAGILRDVAWKVNRVDAHFFIWNSWQIWLDTLLSSGKWKE